MRVIESNIIFKKVPVETTLVAWLETGRHSAALWCIIRGREGEESEFKGTKVSDEANAWQVIPSKRWKTKSHLPLFSNRTDPEWLTAAPTVFQSLYLHIHIQKGCRAQGRRVQVFIPPGNPFIHFNVLSPAILLYCYRASFLPTQTQYASN